MVSSPRVLTCGALAFALVACGKPKPPQEAPAPPKIVSEEEGKATWYDVPDGSLAERRGPESGLTAAHRNLPIGSKVRVTNQENQHSVEVEITDRGIGRDPVIDVSKEAAEKLEMVKEGKVPVKVEALEKPAAAKK